MSVRSQLGIEWEGRGTIHVHVLVYISKSPNPLVTKKGQISMHVPVIAHWAFLVKSTAECDWHAINLLQLRNEIQLNPESNTILIMLSIAMTEDK